MKLNLRRRARSVALRMVKAEVDKALEANEEHDAANAARIALRYNVSVDCLLDQLRFQRRVKEVRRIAAAVGGVPTGQ